MPELNLTYLDSQIQELLRQTGKYILNEFSHFPGNRVSYKGVGDPFTHVDVTTEEILKARCEQLVPEAGFIAEETAANAQPEGLVWIIDPIDGTVNFIHGIPHFCISIALVDQSEILMGHIYQPSTGDMWSAIKGEGAWYNGKTMQVSATTKLDEAIIATGFPYDKVPWPEAYLQTLFDFQLATHGVRRFGAAALDLAYVAMGRFEAFYEYNLKPWDVAAGALLIQEAGGQLSDFRGEKEFLFARQIVASNRALHSDVLQILHRRIPALT